MRRGGRPAILFAALMAIAALTACHSYAPLLAPVTTSPDETIVSAGRSPIQHVVIIVQENRTPDYLFQGISGADIAKYGIDSRGKRVRLRPVSLKSSWDLAHAHSSFVQDYNGGKMNGFDAGLPRDHYLRPFGYAPESEVAPYHEMAKRYVLADHMFQSNQGPSFPAHLYFVSGTAGDEAIDPDKVSANPLNRVTGESAPGGCDADKNVYVQTIDPRTGHAGPTPFPCFRHAVLTQFLDAKRVSWRYYQPHDGAGRWEALDAYRNVRYSRQYRNVVWPSQRILTEIEARRLPNVAWVIPAGAWSDHAGRSSSTKGPAWVAAIVNKLGESEYWRSTAIFVTWDDWGGWYDHVQPPIYSHDELGFRVPLLVISPYAKRGYVSKVPHEFGSLLVFVEKTFGIRKGALGTTDRRSDDLMDAFDFKQQPRKFEHIKAPAFHPGSNDGYAAEDEDL